MSSPLLANLLHLLCDEYLLPAFLAFKDQRLNSLDLLFMVGDLHLAAEFAVRAHINDANRKGLFVFLLIRSLAAFRAFVVRRPDLRLAAAVFWLAHKGFMAFWSFLAVYPCFYAAAVYAPHCPIYKLLH